MCINVERGHYEETKRPRTRVFMKFSLCFGPQKTYLKQGRILQEHLVHVYANRDISSACRISMNQIYE